MPCSMAFNAADDRRLSYSPRCAWHAAQHAACFSCPCRSCRSCASARRSSRRRKRRRSSSQRSFRYVRANTRRAPRVPRVPRPGEADACVPRSPTHADGARAHAAEQLRWCLLPRCFAAGDGGEADRRRHAHRRPSRAAGKRVSSASAAPPCRTQVGAVSRSGSAAQTSIGFRAQT